MLTIEHIIENEYIFMGKPALYELLTGGYVNKVYKVICGNNAYCVRINNSLKMPYFALDTGKEALACHQASMFSIAPAVYNLDNAKLF